MSTSLVEHIFQFNVLNLLVINDEMTLRDIVEELTRIEGEQGYEQAREIAQSLDYDKVCDLCDISDGDNDPNIMPSRFMLLPGADDDSLQANGCLNAAPWPIHPDAPTTFSIAFMKQCLIIGGYIEGEKPVWQSTPAEEDTQQESEQADAIESTATEQPAIFDEVLLAAYQQYLANRTKTTATQRQQAAGQHQVKAGETLSAIAEKYGYKYWQILWQSNQDTLENPDLIKEGDTLTLPKEPPSLAEWLKEQDADQAYISNNNYHFPAHYFSLSLVDDMNQPEEASDGNIFEAYTKVSKESDAETNTESSAETLPHLFYQLTVSNYDQLGVLLPDADIGVGFSDNNYSTPSLLLASMSLYKTCQSALNGTNQTATVTDDDDDLMPDDYPLANQ